MAMPILSTIAAFDDIRRCNNVLIDGTAEIEFLQFLEIQENFRKECLNSVHEAQRLQKELDASLKSLADLETKLFHARRLLEMESKARRAAEHERDQMEGKIVAVADLLQHERNLKDETKDKLAFLNTLPRKRKSLHPHVEVNYGNEINSTASFLSDLSITQSEDDFLDTRNNSKTWKKHRPSLPKNAVPCVGTKRSRKSIETPKSVKVTRRSETRRSSNQHADQNNERICATTKVTIPQDGNGVIRAESTIETLPANNEAKNREEECSSNGEVPVQVQVPRTPHRSPFKDATAPPLTPATKTPGHASSTNTPSHHRGTLFRQHSFITKTFYRYETCSHCQRKIPFGSVSMRCRNCPVRCHIDCRNLVSVICVPQSGTPTMKGPMGYIGDYTPSTPPMVPALIVHCVNEIERRGLDERGLYRQSATERPVKKLKELFLRGKSIPHLANIDVHVLCCCIKDFLRSLQELLIPMNLWKDFSNAVQNPIEEDIQKGLYKAVNALPQPNRDTLAFLMLHFQRVAESKESLMPIDNLARIFGPTLVAHSTLEPDQHSVFTEIHIQCSIVANLLKLSSDYWSQFINSDSEKENFQSASDVMPEIVSPFRGKDKDTTYSLYATPFKSNLKKRKMFGTTPRSNLH